MILASLLSPTAASKASAPRGAPFSRRQPPSLIYVAAATPEASPTQELKQVSALSLTAGRSFPLSAICVEGQCVGSSNGWIAVQSPSLGMFLLNPLGGKEEELFLPWNDNEPVSKIVFPPNPTRDDYVVAIRDRRRLAYTRARNVRWMMADVAMEKGDHLADLAFDADCGKVYCVTAYGGVHVLHFTGRQQGQRRRPFVEPLQPDPAGLPFDPAAVYAPPYNAASKFTGFKRIFFVGGSLYQLWRNTTSAVSWAMPGGERFRMAKDKVFVLKYDPERRPCWYEVEDLGGCSVFIGKHSYVVLKAGDELGVRANCVYWIDDWSME